MAPSSEPTNGTRHEGEQVSPAARSSKDRKLVQLNQQLTITKQLGRGKLGAIYLAVHGTLARRFAVRVFKAALTKPEAQRNRLRHAVREVSQIDHPQSARVHDYGELPDGRIYLTIDYIHGEPLDRTLMHDERLPVRRCLPLLIQLAEVLESAHQKRIVHGDLKLGDLLLCEGVRQQEALCVTDFGFSAALDVRGQPMGNDDDRDGAGEGERLVAVAYCAPERLKGQRCDVRADIYSFGAVAYHLITGEPPFVGATPQEIEQAHHSRPPIQPSRRCAANDVPKALDDVLVTCLEKRPADRFSSMAAVADELEAICQREGGSSRPKAKRTLDSAVTQRWQRPTEESDPGAPDPNLEVPDNPNEIRRLYYSLLLDGARAVLQLGAATSDLERELAALEVLQVESRDLTSYGRRVENSFEEVRRELQDRGTVLRHRIIDLRLVRGEVQEGPSREKQLSDIDREVAGLDEQIGRIDEERHRRFAELNENMADYRRRRRSLEHQAALHFHRLNSELDRLNESISDENTRQLIARIQRHREALALHTVEPPQAAEAGSIQAPSRS